MRHWKRWARRHSAARADVARRERASDLEVRAADTRQRDAEQLAAQSRTFSAALRQQIDQNGWTELLQQAWARR